MKNNKISRKKLLGIGLGLVFLSFIGKFKSFFPFAEREIPKVDKKNQIAFYVDVNACVGCRACTAVCQEYYKIPYPLRFRKVYPRESAPIKGEGLGIRMFAS